MIHRKYRNLGQRPHGQRIVLPMLKTIHHRIKGSGPTFAGTEIYAAGGVHEEVFAILDRVLPSGTRIADLGAGSGSFSLRLKSAGYAPLAVDMDVEVRPDGIPFFEANINDLSALFGEGSLPAAVAIEVVEHLHNPIGFLKSVFDALEPGGLFLVTTPNILHPFSKLKFVLDGTFAWFSRNAYWDTGHITPLPEWILRSHFTSVGYQDIQYGLIGNFDFSGKTRQMLTKTVLRPRRTAAATLGIKGDGSNLVMLARKPKD